MNENFIKSLPTLWKLNCAADMETYKLMLQNCRFVADFNGKFADFAANYPWICSKVRKFKNKNKKHYTKFKQKISLYSPLVATHPMSPTGPRQPGQN